MKLQLLLQLDFYTHNIILPHLEKQKQKQNQAFIYSQVHILYIWTQVQFLVF